MSNLTWETICKQLQHSLPPEFLDNLRNNFELLQVKGSKVCIGYYDKDVYQELISSYNYEIFGAVSSLLGTMASIKYKHIELTNSDYFDINSFNADFDSGYSNKSAAKKPAKKQKYGFGFILCTVLCVLLCFAILAAGMNFVQNLSFRETFYTMSSTKVHNNLRIIQLSDLHNSTYGSNNKTLLERVDDLSPDIIVMTGDCIDMNGSTDQVVTLCKKLVEIAPTYYIYGNNENYLAFDNDMSLKTLDKKFGFDDDNRDPQKLYDSDAVLKKRLESSGVTVLLNESDTITVGNSTVEVFGCLTSNPSAFWPYAGNAFQQYLDDTADFKIFLSHDPFLFENEMSERWGDVAFTGHTHGGVFRVPGVGALYSNGNGFLPEMKGAYVYGQYELAKSQLIVSAGLAKNFLTRINNRPELVVVDVNKY